MAPAVLSRATVVGSLLFGAGWAIGGICPGSGLVQLGHGTLMTLLTLAGMCTGMWSYPVVQRRLFPGSPSSGCDG
jgi:uncharacterized membrane protein YedE/YeeE